MRILIAPNAFKNSLDATAAADALHQGFVESSLSCDCRGFPVGDGGDGTAALLIRFCNAENIPVETTDALGRKITSSFGFLAAQKTAIIELADASGLRQLQPEEYNPLVASTYGTGKIITAALDRGAEKIIMGIGGSATVDGASGILQALGLRFLDNNDKEISAIPAELARLKSIDLSGMDNRIPGIEFIILCDVDNGLLGQHGAASVFGPQKGATPAMTALLENALSRLRDIVLAQTGFDMAALQHGGAAGGVSAGLAALTKARLVNGIEYFLEMTHFEEALNNADLVITGEGSIDEQTLSGKAPFGVARRAKARNLPVIGVAGKVPGTPSPGLDRYFNVLMAIGSEPCTLEKAMAATSADLKRTGKLLGNLLAMK